MLIEAASPSMTHMSEPPALRIRYWGTTGTFARPIGSAELTGKIAAAIVSLRDSGRLKNVVDGSLSVLEIEALLTNSLPLHERSTYGGNTTCVEVRSPNDLLILDAGSGLVELGYELERRWNAPGYCGSRRAHVLLSHSHMDHTYATPFVLPFFDPDNEITIWAPQSVLDNLNAVLDARSALGSIFFPQTYGLLQGIKQLNPIELGSEFTIGDVTVRSLSLNHPGGCVGYRLSSGGKSFVFVTDHEQLQSPDVQLAEFARGADILYADAQYLLDEYEGRVGIGDERAISRVGWGHSTVEGAIATAIAAGVRVLHLGHHDPRRSDEALYQLEQYAIEVAREQLHRANLAADSLSVQLAHDGFCCRL